MPDYSDYDEVMQLLKEAQDADEDNRERAREAHYFVDKRDGQWEPFWWDVNKDKPRYTFDMTNAIVDQVAGEMEQADFDIRVKPSGGEASEDIADIYDGLIRNIENLSNAKEVFNQAGRSMVTGGLDGWRVVQAYVDGNSFDQDLLIRKVHNFIDRCWLDVGAEEQDCADARHGWLLHSMPRTQFNEKYPERAAASVNQSRFSDAYFDKADVIIIGEFFYIKEVPRELVLMSNGAVYEVDEKYEQVADDLADKGIVEVKRRKRIKNVVCVRKFDGEGWMDESKETVFDYIPLIPTFGNHKVHENKVIYWGVVEKLLDAQRVLNYSLSREIEEGALAPRAKYWMSPKQAAGHEASLATMNTNADPVQFYNPDQDAPPPQQQGGAQINPGLRTISESMRQIIGQSAGMFAANMGDNPGLQSGVAIESLQNKGDTGTIKYFKSQEIAIRHTARIIVNAIPRVYDTERQVRLLNEDGSQEQITINQQIIDNETGEVVTLNDLSQGTYDVTCSAGASFKNRQQEMVDSFIQAAQVDESLMQLAGDVFLKNVTAPGMDEVAERKRQMLLQQGAIPESQMTDEEKQQLAQAQQNQQPDANTLIAMAEMEKAKAAQAEAQVKQQQQQIDFQIRSKQLEIEAAKLQQSGQKDAISASQKEREFALKIEQLQQDIALKQEEQQRKVNETLAQIQDTLSASEKKQAETMQIMRDLMAGR